jgi:transcriptional regulator with XRE-family HTH domain
MIAQTIVTEVRRLLADETLSQRKIARLMGVSRGTVGTIAAGKRPDYEMLRPAQEDDRDEPAGPPERCPGCGGMVYLPCRLCRVRERAARIASPTQRKATTLGEEPLGLNLRSDHRARYEEVRAWRRENPSHCFEECAAP